MTPQDDTVAALRAEIEAMKAVLAPVIAAVVLSPLTDDDEKTEIQRLWARLNAPRSGPC